MPWLFLISVLALLVLEVVNIGRGSQGKLRTLGHAPKAIHTRVRCAEVI
jgi:hypothetical protein